ncbi:MAG: hypothetical protein Q7R57_07480 [Dehalococcoidales bacterium]|nr:hypothetical protein [Dehalococcoidales bacterium]
MKTSIILAALLVALAAIVSGCNSSVAPTAATTPSSTPAKTGTPLKLVFTAQPGRATAGLAFETEPAVAAQDAGGNIVTAYKGLVVLAITPGTGAPESHLFGGTTVGLANSPVGFRDVFIDKAGAGYTLTATSGNLTPATSMPFTVSPGAAYQLVFTVQPPRGMAGSPLVTPPEVTVLDRYGNTVTNYEGSVTLAVTYGTGPAAISGTTTVHVVNNVARFTDLSFTRTYPLYTLTATNDALVSAVSSPFEVSAAAPTKLEFTVQPVGAKPGTPFETQPKVAVEDAYGNVVTASRAPIALSITAGTGIPGATLSGTKTLAAEGGLGGGLAEFDGLSINRADHGYTLTATSSGLTSATSQAFDVASP